MSFLNEEGSLESAYRNGQRGNASNCNVLSSADLFTGNVKLPLTLGYLDGRDGLSVTVQAEYLQSNPENYNKRNRKLPCSVLGYNWDIALPAIVVKNRLVKQAYQREFYLIGGGGQYPLYRNGRKEDCVEFFSVEQPNWKFYFYDNEEETFWEIWKEDGSIYKYGGSKDSNELTVCWDNWVGPILMNGAQSFTTAWHLSMIESTKGSQVLYEYENVLENLADAVYTRAVRLHKVISSYQEGMVFHYKEKDRAEYGVNHENYEGENAYQERYEDKYLDKIEFFNVQNKLLYTQQLEYVLKSSKDNERKRFLLSITQVTSDGTKMTPLSLSYTTAEGFAGMLQSIKYPLASEVTYDYGNLEFSKSDGYMTFDIESGWDYKVYNGGDFHFVLLKRDNHIKFQIYDWDMGWHQQEDISMLDIPVEDIRVNLGGGYICITYKDLLENRYKLKIIKRCPVRRFDWEIEEWCMENSDTCPAIAWGRDFVAFQCTEQNALKILQYKYTDNKWHENVLGVESREFQALGAGDGFLFGAFGDSDISQVRLMSFYSDEDHEWQFGDTMDVSVEVDWKLVMRDYVWAISYAQAGACFITYKDNIVKTTLVLLAWTDQFKFTKFEVHDFRYSDQIKNQYFFAIATDTMIGYAENIYRYCHNGWNYQKVLETRPGGEYRYAYGSDVVLAVEQMDGVQRFSAMGFDPYAQGWTREGVPASEDLYQFDEICQPLIVDEYAVLGRKIFTRNVDNTWDFIGYLDDQTDYENVQIDSEGGYLLYQLKGHNRVYQVPFEDNMLSDKIKICHDQCIDSEKTGGYQAGISAFYTFNPHGSTSAVNFYQLHDKKYKDKQSRTLLKCITSNNGAEKQNIYFLYDLDTARLEGGKAAMQCVFVCPVREDGTRGKTEYRYFNGASTDTYAYPDDEYTNVKCYYSHMSGRLSSSMEYDGEGNIVSSSRNWLKAFDTLGFTICQTKIMDTKYLRFYHVGNCNEGNEIAEIRKTAILEYEDQFFLKRKVTQIGMDQNGKEVKLSNEIHYLWEENEDILKKNALSDISMTVKKEEISGQVLEVNNYKYKFDTKGHYYQSESLLWDHTGDYLKDEGNWICTNRITQVNGNCDKVCEEDADGLKTVYLYDKNNKFITGKFDNAEPGEVCYCGFEPYEDCQKITMKSGHLSNYIDKNQKFSGTQSVAIETNNAILVKLIRNGTDSRISFAIKTEAEWRISWGSTKEQSVTSYPTTMGKWKQINAILANAKKETGPLTITIAGLDKIHVDALFVSPMLSQGEAYVYTTDFMIQTASHKNWGRGARIFYDRYQNAVATSGDDGTFIGYSRKCFGSKQAIAKLDETMSMEMPKGGCFQWLEQDWGNTACWKRENTTWTFEQNKNFALFFAVHGGNQSLTYGNFSIGVSGSEWRITENGTVIAKAAKTDGKHYLFLIVGDRVQFSCEDQIIYTGIHNFSQVFQTILMGDSIEDFVCIGYCKEPKISLSYSDYAGKPHQDIAVLESGIIAGQTIYNELGQGEITSKKVYLEGQMWQYRDRLVTSYDWTTGFMKGEIAEKHTEDGGFAYSQIRSSVAPSPEPLEIGQPGKAMAIKGDRKTARFGSYTNEGELYGLKEKSYTLKVQTTPDNIVNVDVMDVFGNKIMFLSKNNEEEEFSQITKFEYDYNGNLTRVYYPNYFTEVKENEKYISDYIYDSLGRMVMQKEPDSGMARFIYDRTGKIRFSQNGNDSSYYLYYVYDKYTRKIEVGRVDGAWNQEALQKEANNVGVPPKNAIPKAKYYYDGDGKQISLVRKLSCVETFSDSGVLETKEEFVYNAEGNVSQKTTTIGTNIDVIKIKYDMAQNVIEYSMGEDERETVGYIYDIQSRLIGASYMGRMLYSCAYLEEGNVSEERFLPKQGDGLCRQYFYDSAMWLRKLQDNFFQQELEYDTTTGKAGLGGRITKCTSRFLKNAPTTMQQEIMYNYSYDASGRLKGYRKENQEYTLIFDANGNQTGDSGSTGTFSYESGTNKLLSCKESVFQYDSIGNTKWIDDEQMYLDYDKGFNKIKCIRKGDKEITYTYGTQGNSSYTTSDGTTFVGYDAGGRILSEVRNGKRTICIYGANGIAAQIRDGKVYYFIKDYQSSVRGIYDGEKILAAFSYDPFGNFEENVVLDASVKELIPIRFTSARYEEEMGLYRMKYRLYDPYLGRFLNIDPENQYASPYIYGGADWVNYFDPDGAISLGSILSMAVGVVLIAAGAAIAIGTAGMGTGVGVALGFLGAGLIGAGIGVVTYGISSAINDDFDIVDCLIYGGIGFIGGMAGAGIGAGITALTPVMGATASGIVDIGVGIVVGGTDSLVSNGLININHSRDFFDNWVMNVTIGCVVGGVAAGFSGMSSALRNNRAFIGRNAQNTIGVENFRIGRFGHLHTTYETTYGNAVTIKRYTDFGYGPRGARGPGEVSDMVYRVNQYGGRSMGEHAMQVNPSTMQKFRNNGVRIAADYTHAPGFREVNPFGPNCTTYTIDRLSGGGVNMPIWLRTPSLVNKWAAWICKFQ